VLACTGNMIVPIPVGGLTSDFQFSAASSSSQNSFSPAVSNGGWLSGGNDSYVQVNTVQYSFNLGFAADGNITSGNDQVNGNWSYTYDQFNRLATAVASGISKGCQESYDRFGNRWSQQPYGGAAFACSPFSASFTGNNTTNTNRIDGYSYDAGGNLLNDATHSYTYDAENRISSVDGATNYIYDAEGRRAAKRNGSTITAEYLLDVAGATSLELDGSGGTVVHGELAWPLGGSGVQADRTEAVPALRPPIAHATKGSFLALLRVLCFWRMRPRRLERPM